MTHMEFYEWLNKEFEKHPMLNLSWEKDNYVLNELVHILRLSGRDLCINTTDPDSDGFGIIPSIVEAYIPTRDLARKIDTIRYEEFEDDGKVYPLLNVTYKSEKRRRK